MKKYFTIFMAVLCLATFSISDANAKARKKTNKSRFSCKYRFDSKRLYCGDISMDDNGEIFIEFIIIIKNQSSGVLIILDKEGNAKEKTIIKIESKGDKRFVMEAIFDTYKILFDGIIDPYKNIVEDYDGKVIFTFKKDNTQIERSFHINAEYE